MRVLALIHQDDARSGVFADAAHAAGAELEEASLALGRPPAHPLDSYDATIVLGGGMHVDQAGRHPWLDDEKELIAGLIERERPLLGVCLGSQLVAEAAGARVEPLPGGPEIGWVEVEVAPQAGGDPLAAALPERFLALEWHSYGSGLPPGAVELARNGAGIQAYRLGAAPAWGVQFHAEVTDAILAGWIEHDSGDDDFRAAGVDAGALAAQTEREIGRWNAIGRGLCAAFLDEAVSRR